MGVEGSEAKERTQVRVKLSLMASKACLRRTFSLFLLGVAPFKWTSPRLDKAKSETKVHWQRWYSLFSFCVLPVKTTEVIWMFQLSPEWTRSIEARGWELPVKK